MDFDNPKVYGDTSITDGLVFTYAWCPVDCKVDDWTSWSQCSKTCGGGTRKRSMDIIKEPKNGGAPCPQKLDEEEECNTDKCKGSLKTFLSPSGDLGIGLV